MTTAYRSSSVSGRLRTLALAGTLALGTMFPITAIVRADAGDTVVVDSTGEAFDVSGEGVSGLTAVIAGGGDGVNLRAEPAHDADVVASLPDGTTVDLRIDVLDTVYDADGVTRWWPVSVDGMEGWVSGFFLAAAPADASSDDEGVTDPVAEDTATKPSADIPVETGTQFEYHGEITESASARVVGSGESVNVRAEPSAASELLTTAADGQVVTLRIAAVDTVYDADGVTRWWPVSVDGIEGWISGFYLANTSDSTDAVPVTEEPELSDTTTSPFPAGSYAVVGSGDGYSVTLRAAGSPTAEAIGNLSDGQVVQVMEGPVSFENSVNGWFKITVDDLTGFVDGDLLSSAPEPSAETPVPTAVATTEPAETPVPTVPTEPDETPVPTAAATEADEDQPTETPVPPAVATTEPRPTATATTEPSGEEGVDTPIPAETTDPETTPETDPEDEEAAESTGFIYPLENFTRTQGFGCSSLGFYPYNPDFGCAVHDGLDLAAPAGTPLRAAASGEVVAAGWCDCGLGYYVEIDHGEGVHTVYGHMAEQPYVSTGQQVSQGDIIGPLGSTGISTGPHVHFMVRLNGVAQNPENYLP